MQGISSGEIATARLGQIGQHLGMATTIRIDPVSKKVTLEFGWDDAQAMTTSVASGVQSVQPPQVQEQRVEKKKVEEIKVEQKEFTLEDVAKHNSKTDCWVCRPSPRLLMGELTIAHQVVVNGQVLDATSFMPDRTFPPALRDRS